MLHKTVEFSGNIRSVQFDVDRWKEVNADPRAVRGEMRILPDEVVEMTIFFAKGTDDALQNHTSQIV